MPNALDSIKPSTYETTEEWLMALYAEHGTFDKVGEAIGFSPRYVWQRLRDSDFARRRPGRPDHYTSLAWQRCARELDETHQREPIIQMAKRIGVSRPTISRYRKYLREKREKSATSVSQ